MSKRKICELSFVVVAALLLLVPALFTNTEPEAISQAEKRWLAEPVPLSEGFSNFMDSLNSSANDRIGFRDEMVWAHGTLTMNLLEMNHKRVIRGEDGWLFYREDMPDYTGQNNEPLRVEAYVQVIKAIDKLCASRGSQFIFIVGPNKSSVYHRYMPDYIQKAEVRLLDALAARLEEEGIRYIIPTEKLIEASESVECYKKLDIHWNAYAAKYVMDELAEMLELPAREFTMTESRQKEGDLLLMLAFPPENAKGDSLVVDVAMNPDAHYEEIPGTKDLVLHNEGGESFVCYRDSFSWDLEGFYSYYFDGPLYWNWDILSLPEEAFPKYVIFETVELGLQTCLEECASILGMQ